VSEGGGIYVRLGAKAGRVSEIDILKKKISFSLCAELERFPKLMPPSMILCLVLILSRLLYAQRALLLQCSPNLVHTCQRNCPPLACSRCADTACMQFDTVSEFFALVLIPALGT
jgi:hypothetical protein